jgi:preprotein translocase subunit SecE
MSSIAKRDKSGESGFLKGLFQAGLYKPTQGRIIRQVTWACAALLLVLLAFEVSNTGWVVNLFKRGLTGGHYMLFVLLAASGVWFAYRLVNYPKFADFLISVEAEMNKVSWPDKHQIWRASIVVIAVILAMAVMLYAFDLIWTGLFQFLGIRSR